MLAGGLESQARADWLAHQEARDTLEAMLVKLGATPAAASPAYRLPFAGHRPASAVRLAVFSRTAWSRPIWASSP